MKKISITAQLAAYTVSMLMGFGTFAAWNYVSIPQEIQMNSCNQSCFTWYFYWQCCPCFFQ